MADLRRLTLTNVTLRCQDVDRLLEFYRTILGFTTTDSNRTVSLHGSESGSPLLKLQTEAGAVRRKRESTGLFHVALRFPARKSLALVFKRLYESQYPFEGFADHGVSEAIYTADPEGNGVELYWDKPRSVWPYANGELLMKTDPLDLENLTAELTAEDEWPGLDPGVDVGHIHLNVADLKRSEEFYRGLGLDVTQRTYPGALFMSVGGYHHNIAVNTWAGRRKPSPNETGLVSFDCEIAGNGLTPAPERLTDPDGNSIQVRRVDEN